MYRLEPYSPVPVSGSVHLASPVLVFATVGTRKVCATRPVRGSSSSTKSGACVVPYEDTASPTRRTSRLLRRKAARTLPGDDVGVGDGVVLAALLGEDEGVPLAVGVTDGTPPMDCEGDVDGVPLAATLALPVALGVALGVQLRVGLPLGLGVAL